MKAKAKLKQADEIGCAADQHNFFQITNYSITGYTLGGALTPMQPIIAKMVCSRCGKVLTV